MDKERLCFLANEVSSYAKELRDKFHINPELSDKEFETQRIICEELNAMGIEYSTYDDMNGIVGLIRSGRPGKTVALRADMDALPIKEKNETSYKSRKDGVMHACGHDVHMAILLGTAKVLSNIKGGLEGNIKILFQPAEETDGGAKRMIERGCMENPKVDYVFSQHVEPEIECGLVRSKAKYFNASSNTFYVIIKGKKSHGAYPEQGIDAVYTGASIIMSLQSLVSRRISAVDPAVLTIGKIEGGTASNIVADEVKFTIMLRTTSKETREKMIHWIQDTIELMCRVNGAECEIDTCHGYDAIYNDPGCTNEVERICNKYLGENSYLTLEAPFMGVEDFAYFLTEAPGNFYQLGCRDEKNGIVSGLHFDTFDVAEGTIEKGILMQCALACEFLSKK